MGIDRTDRIGPAGQYRFTGPSSAGRGRAQPREQALGPASGDEAATDRISLSSAARELASAPPEDREDLIRRIRDQVRSGSYQVDPDSIARRMVNRGEM